VAKPDLGTKRLCPNCGAKYYDLNRDPIMCPKCNAAFATGIVAVRPETQSEEADEELEADEEGVELVALEEADEEVIEGSTTTDIETDDEVEVEVEVDTDDAALIDEDDDEVSEVVRGTDGEDEDR